jgi:transcriptional regulator NrdR family protein
MNCPDCGSCRVKVTDTKRPSTVEKSRTSDLERLLGSHNGVARRRRCEGCGNMWTTLELAVEVPPATYSSQYKKGYDSRRKQWRPHV